MGRIFVLPLLAFVLIFQTGCTRGDGKSSTVSLSLPKLSKKSMHKGVAGQVKAANDPSDPVLYNHVVINIHGGSEVVQYHWDRHQCPASNKYCQPPATIKIENVPNGAGRLLQVLAVTGVDEEGDTFWYGDQTKDISGGDISFNVTINPFTGSVNQRNGQIMGRYYAYAADGVTVINPSGMITTRILPPDPTKPGVIVDTKEMFAGWFSVFSLEDVDMTYDLQGYGQLFGGPVNLLSSFGPSVMEIDIPATYQAWGDGRRAEETVLLGRFGDADESPTAQSLDVCVDGGSHTYTNRINADMFAPIDYPLDIPITTTNGVCSGVDPMIDFMTFNPMGHDSQGTEGAAGFRGPFMGGTVTGGYYSTVGIDTSGANPVIKWNLLPGINSSVISGINIFARQELDGSSDSRDYEGPNGGVNCAGLTSKNFQLLNASPIPNGTNTYTASQLTSMSNATVILCPIRAGGAYSSEAAETHYNSGMGGSYTPENATSLVITTESVLPNHISINAPCIPVKVEGFKNGKHASINGSLTISTNNASVNVYSSGYCSSPISGPVMPSAGDSHEFFIKSSISGTLPAGVTLTVSSGSLTATKTFSFVQVPNTIVEMIKITAPQTSIRAFECYEARAEKWHGSVSGGVTTPVMMAHFSSGGMLNPPADFTLYYANPSEQPCASNTMTSYVYLSMDDTAKFYYRYTGSNASASLVLTSGDGKNVKGPGLTISQPGVPVRYSIDVKAQGQQMEEQGCYEVTVQAQDRRGYPAGVPDPVNLDVQDFGYIGTFYSDVSCSTPLSSPTLAQGEVETSFYYQPTVQGSALLAVMDDGAEPLIGLRGFQVGPPTADRIQVVMPGETYDSINGLQGSIINPQTGTNFTLTFYAINIHGEIDTTYNYSFNEPDLNYSNMSFVSRANFVNGVATVTFFATDPTVGYLNWGNFQSKSNGTIGFDPGYYTIPFDP